MFLSIGLSEESVIWPCRGLLSNMLPGFKIAFLTKPQGLLHLNCSPKQADHMDYFVHMYEVVRVLVLTQSCRITRKHTSGIDGLELAHSWVSLTSIHL
eukprot:CCRYP_019183-RA/>CCRYP_019183-RA protein AED:0.20 eAED:1.00 QI:0/-1/0/1/-1/0/1/0/97